MELCVENVKELYESGLSQEKIGKKLGVSQWKVSDFMRKNNIKRRHKLEKAQEVHRININHYFLDDINEYSAWFIGWVLSDGCITDKNTVSFSLNVKDIDVLEKIADMIEHDRDIKRYTTKLNGKEFNHARLYFTSERFIKVLNNWGITPNKTLHETYPQNVKNMDDNLKRAFIRGIFEGDGSIFKSKSSKNAICFQIVGTYELLEGIQQELINILGVSKTKITKNGVSENNHYALRYNGVKYPKIIMDWIYKGSNIHMNRKYNIYKEIV